MKIGACWEFFENWGDNRYHKLKECGFTHIDFGMSNAEGPLYACEMDEFQKRLIGEKERMDAVGIQVSQVHGTWHWPPQDTTQEERNQRMEEMKRSLYGASLLECKNWVMHPIMPYGVQEKGTPEAEKTWNMNKEYIGALLETAKQYGITICLENLPLPAFSMGSVEEVLKFVKEVGDDHLKVCLDTGHAAVYEDLTPAGAVRLLGEELRVLHVHDNRGSGDLHLLPYFGVVDWKDFGQALKEIDFQGVFSYEVFLPLQIPVHHLETICRMLVRMAQEICE